MISLNLDDLTAVHTLLTGKHHIQLYTAQSVIAHSKIDIWF